MCSGRASLCLEKQSIASLRQPKALLFFQTPFHPLWRRDARPSVNWSASLGECRLRSLRVSVDEFTPRSSRQNEFRDAHHGGRVQDSLICCQEVCQQLLILVHTILCRSLNCCRSMIGLLRSLMSKMSSLSPVICEVVRLVTRKLNNAQLSETRGAFGESIGISLERWTHPAIFHRNQT